MDLMMHATHKMNDNVTDAAQLSIFISGFEFRQLAKDVHVLSEGLVDLGKVVFVLQRPTHPTLHEAGRNEAGRNYVIVDADFMSKLLAFIAFVLSDACGYDAELARATKLGIALSELATPWDSHGWDALLLPRKRPKSRKL